MSGTTNQYAELSDPATMVHRYRGTRLWDWPIPVWTSAVEYATRIVEMPGLTLPASGGPVELRDLSGRVIDYVPYTNAAPWPVYAGVAIEVIDPRADNSTGTAWRASLIVGTPGDANSAMSDRDGDGMDDAWEQRIVDANPADAITNVWTALPNADFDNDGVPNQDEFVLGTDPTTDDAEQAFLTIRRAGNRVAVDFDTLSATGTAYSLYDARLYTLERITNLAGGTSWTGVVQYMDVPGTGQAISYTNTPADSNAFYRYEIRLRPRR